MLSLIGDIAEQHGQPALHMHAVLGRRDGSTVGGHLLRGEVWPTLEVIVTEVAESLAKRVDPETGLALLAGTTRTPMRRRADRQGERAVRSREPGARPAVARPHRVEWR